MTSIAVSRMHFPVTTLGPGNRVGLWTQGCSIRCAGCISPDTWDASPGATTLSEVINRFSGWAAVADGLTVSGGEPFDQSEALADLLAAWRDLSDSDVLVFTGFPFAEVKPWLDLHPGLVDAVIAGPFRLQAPQTLALRGSDNQTLHLLTPRGEAAFGGYDRSATPEDRRFDLMFDEEGGVWFAGIPARGDFDRLRRGLRAAGHRIVPSQRGARS
jgi:anaerobic ribonucleoside-triphosphate reductase activating protein